MNERLTQLLDEEGELQRTLSTTLMYAPLEDLCNGVDRMIENLTEQQEHTSLASMKEIIGKQIAMWREWRETAVKMRR